jgi:hypothetical protein
MDEWNEMMRRQIEVLDLRLEKTTSERERQKLQAIRVKLEERSDQDPALSGTLTQISKRLSDRAEECRVIADNCASSQSQNSFKRMAWNYDQLAQRAARAFTTRRP